MISRNEVLNPCNTSVALPLIHGPPALALHLLQAGATPMKLQVHIRKGIEGVQAYCPALPGCSATAPHEAEALRRLRERIARCFTSSTTPLPGTRVVHIEV